jgi:hypothetical protein
VATGCGTEACRPEARGTEACAATALKPRPDATDATNATAAAHPAIFETIIAKFLREQ